MRWLYCAAPWLRALMCASTAWKGQGLTVWPPFLPPPSQQIFPFHVLEYLSSLGATAGGPAPEKIAGLARHHPNVTVLFLDVVGECVCLLGTSHAAACQCLCCPQQTVQAP